MLQAGELVLARYRLSHPLAGTGLTWLAEMEALGRKVVVKGFPEGQSGGWRAFQRELTDLAALSHPAVAAPLDFGELEDGLPVLVSPYVEGRSLEEDLRKGPLDWKDAVQVGLRLCEGLAHLHQRRLIHRDLKPSNVVIPGGAGTPRWDEAVLIDLGGLGLLLQRRGEARSETRAGQIFGTPRYMSPEQVVGDPQSVATDVYCFGLLLCEMLFGRLPFDPVESVSTHLFRVVSEDPVLPSKPDLPEPLHRLIAACLHRRPEDRPAGMAACLEALQACRASSVNFPPAPASMALPAPLSAAPGRGPSRLRWLGLGLLVLIPLCLGLAMSGGPRRTLVWGLASMAVGGGVGFAVSRELRNRRPKAELRAKEAFREALSGKRPVEDLGSGLREAALEIMELCQGVDQRFLAMSLAILVEEYRKGPQGQGGLDALVKATQLVKDLGPSLSPWYMRHDRLVGWGISLLGLVPGLFQLVHGLKP